MPSSLRVAVPGAVVALVGAVIAFTVWRIGGLVVLMIGAVLLLAARFLRSNELSSERRSGRRST